MKILSIYGELNTNRIIIVPLKTYNKNIIEKRGIFSKKTVKKLIQRRFF